MDHQSIIQLTIAYTLLGAFVFTALSTCFSMVGWIKFANEAQQRRLFGVLVVELVVGSLAFFFDFIQFNPVAVAQRIATEAEHNTKETIARMLTEEEQGDAVVPVSIHISGTADMYRAALDGKRIALLDGEARFHVSRGNDHVLTWWVKGAPGSRFTIRVKVAGMTDFVHTGLIDKASTSSAGLTFVNAS